MAQNPYHRLMSTPNLQPTLIGPRLTLRPIRPSDWSALADAAADPDIWAGHTQTDRYKTDVFRGFFDTAIASHSAFVVVDNETGALIGSSRYHNHDAALSEIEIGWTFLTRPYWGGGYNAEMKRLLLAHAFTFVETVVFWVAVENEISAKAMAKIGGRAREGTISRPDPDGSNDMYRVFEITKDAFARGPLSQTA